MEKGLLAVVLLCSVHISSAQIIIDMTDMPQESDILEYTTTTITVFDSSDTGPNHIWDFSQLTANMNDADTAVSVGDTPFLYQFYFNNALLYPDHKADFAIRGMEFGTAQFSVSDVFDYYKVDNDGYRSVGFGANINGIPSSVRRIPVDRIYSLPMNYNDVDASFSAFEFQVPTLVYFQEDQWRDNEVDGWGTLTLPSGQYDVLRQKSTIVRDDTMYVDLLGFGFRPPRSRTVEYKWLAMGEDQPVLQVTTVGGVPTQVRYKDQVVGVDELGADQSVHIWSAMDHIFVNVPTSITGPVTLTLFDVQGRMALETTIPLGSSRHPFNTNTVFGTYLARVTWKNGEVLRKVILK